MTRIRRGAIDSREEIIIPRPVAYPDDDVQVLNYRNGKWEKGTVRSAQYQLDKIGDGRWRYCVWIDRPIIQRHKHARATGGGYMIYVHSERIYAQG